MLLVGKSRLSGQKACAKNLITIKASICKLVKKKDAKAKDKKQLRTLSENIWFLESILTEPDDDEDENCPVSATDYRYYFIHDKERNAKFDAVKKTVFQKHMKVKKPSVAQIDFFVNEMITTGLELFVSSHQELVKFLAFISDGPPINMELGGRLIVKTTHKCFPRVLSQLYLHCHLLLLVFGYGTLDSSSR
jgi:hypothetical protein